MEGPSNKLQNQSLANRSEEIIRKHSLYSAGAGLIPVPMLDLATLLGIQITMIRKIGRVYGHHNEFRRNKVKRSIQILIADLGTVGVLSGVKALPLVGPVVGMVGAPVYGAAATYALGRVFVLHFDQGGTFLDFDPSESRHHFKDEFEKAQKRDRSSNGSGAAASTAVAAGRTATQKGKIKKTAGTKGPGKGKDTPKTSPVGSAQVTKSSDPYEKDKDTSVAEKDAENTGGGSKNYEVESDVNLEIAGQVKAGRKITRGKSNDFTIIEGIGPKISELITNAGITTMAQLANTDINKLKEILKNAGSRYNMSDPTTWPRQAELAAAGKWEELEALKDRLDGGIDRKQ